MRMCFLGYDEIRLGCRCYNDPYVGQTQTECIRNTTCIRYIRRVTKLHILILLYKE